MKADSVKIAKVFQGGGCVHYVLPHFQREYTWEEREWKTLLNDAFTIYEEIPDITDTQDGEIQVEHFLGSLVVVNSGTFAVTGTRFTLVDGQQRLTSLSLLLCALREAVKSENESLARQINHLLINEDLQGDASFKILPTTKYGDRLAYQAIIKGDRAEASESRVPKAYEYIARELRSKIQSHAILPEIFFQVLVNAFQVVVIEINKTESPYKIFESLNAKGKPLSQADLVRNYIAMTLPASQQEAVFERCWSPIEQMLQEKRNVGKSGLGELTAFLRHYLAHRTGTLCNANNIYERFRDRMNREFSNHSAFVDELSTLHRFAVFYDRLLRPLNEPNLAVRNVMERLAILDVSTAYPFLMAMADACKNEIITEMELESALKTLENYLIRRFLAGEPTNYLNKMFSALWQDIDVLNFIPSLQTALIERKYPLDSKIRQELLKRNLYTSAQMRSQVIFLMEQINRSLSSGTGGHTVLDDNATIEHILPQNPNWEWQTALGEEFERCDEFRHTLGNLTLLTQEWNSELSNSSFAIKKEKLANHALRLNSDYFSQDIPQWNEAAIQSRNCYLTDILLQIWSSFSPRQDAMTSCEDDLLKTKVSGTIGGEVVTTWKEVVHSAIRASFKQGLTSVKDY